MGKPHLVVRNGGTGVDDNCRREDVQGALTNGAGYGTLGAVRSQIGELTILAFRFIDLRARCRSHTRLRLGTDTTHVIGPGSQIYNLCANLANNPTTWAGPSGISVAGNAVGATRGAAWRTLELLLFTCLSTVCVIGCGSFLVAGTLESSSGRPLVLTGLRVILFV